MESDFRIKHKIMKHFLQKLIQRLQRILKKITIQFQNFHNHKSIKTISLLSFSIVYSNLL